MIVNLDHVKLFKSGNIRQPRYVNLGTLQENSFQVTLPSKGAPEAALEEELTSM